MRGSSKSLGGREGGREGGQPQSVQSCTRREEGGEEGRKGHLRCMRRDGNRGMAGGREGGRE